MSDDISQKIQAELDRTEAYFRRLEEREKVILEILESFGISPEDIPDLVWDLEKASRDFETRQNSKSDIDELRTEMVRRLRSARRFTMKAIAEVKRVDAAFRRFGSFAKWEAWRYAFNGRPNEGDLQVALAEIDRNIAKFAVPAHHPKNLAREEFWRSLLQIYRRCTSRDAKLSASAKSEFVGFVQRMHYTFPFVKVPSGNAVKAWLQAFRNAEAKEVRHPFSDDDILEMNRLRAEHSALIASGRGLDGLLELGRNAAQTKGEK